MDLTSEMIDKIDKRKHFRTAKALAITYRPVWADLKTGSKSVDISSGGIRFPIQRRLDEDTLLKLQIHWHLAPDPIDVTGRVAWVRNNISDRFPFEIGVRFEQVPDECLEAINRICDDRSRESAAIQCL